MSRRSRGLALALCLAAALLAASSAAPANAQTGKAAPVVLKIGEKKAIDYPAFPVPNPTPLVESDIQNESQGIVAEPPETPQQCDADPLPCLDIPIDLSMSEAVRLHHTLALSLTVSYADPVVVGTPIGDEEGQSLRCYLWKEHPGKDFAGNPVYVSYDGANNPGFVSAYQFPTRHFFLVVLPTRTLNLPFKIQYSFQDIAADGFRPTVSPPGGTPPAGTPPDVAPPPAFNDPGLTVPPNVPIGGSLPPSVGPAVAPIVVPHIAGGTIDRSLLAASTVLLPNVLGKAGSANVSGAAAPTSTDEKSSSTAAVAIELAILPLLVLLLTGFLFGRRRRQQIVR
ncbi:MAG: hypothetical protein JWN31_1632 [Frankiales bacterium]|nr:hypothetical protein [Frankiales bacterium]